MKPYVLAVLGYTLLAYALTAFMFWNANPAEWTPDNRVALVMVWATLLPFPICAAGLKRGR